MTTAVLRRGVTLALAVAVTGLVGCSGGNASVVATVSSGRAATQPAATPSATGFEAVMESTQRLADEIVGQPEHDAEQVVRAAGLQWRVGQRDGETFSLTMDLRADRITVVVDEGRVTKATAG